jgi:hypothetical protein
MGTTAARRQKQPVNRWGCKPHAETCLEHHETLGCKHGCGYAKTHECKEKAVDIATLKNDIANTVAAE